MATEIETPVFTGRVREDGVLVLPDVAESESKGKIHIPEQARQKPLQGTVVAVGPGKHGEAKPDFTVGARVVYGRYAGHEILIQHGDRNLVLMRLSDVRIVLA